MATLKQQAYEAAEVMCAHREKLKAELVALLPLLNKVTSGEVQDKLAALREAALGVVEAVGRWRGTDRFAVFLWRGADYVAEICSDLDFLADSEALVDMLGLPPDLLRSNPLMLERTLHDDATLVMPTNDEERRLQRAENALADAASRAQGKKHGKTWISKARAQLASMEAPSSERFREEEVFDPCRSSGAIDGLRRHGIIKKRPRRDKKKLLKRIHPFLPKVDEPSKTSLLNTVALSPKKYKHQYFDDEAKTSVVPPAVAYARGQASALPSHRKKFQDEHYEEASALPSHRKKFQEAEKSSHELYKELPTTSFFPPVNKKHSSSKKRQRRSPSTNIKKHHSESDEASVSRAAGRITKSLLESIAQSEPPSEEASSVAAAVLELIRWDSKKRSDDAWLSFVGACRAEPRKLCRAIRAVESVDATAARAAASLLDRSAGSWPSKNLAVLGDWAKRLSRAALAGEARGRPAQSKSQKEPKDGLCSSSSVLHATWWCFSAEDKNPYLLTTVGLPHDEGLQVKAYDPTTSSEAKISLDAETLARFRGHLPFHFFLERHLPSHLDAVLEHGRLERLELRNGPPAGCASNAPGAPQPASQSLPHLTGDGPRRRRAKTAAAKKLHPVT